MSLRLLTKASLIISIVSTILSSCAYDTNINDNSELNIFTSKIPSVPAGKDPNFLTFFSNTYSGDPSIAQNSELNPDKQFIKMINEAKISIDICAYHVDSLTITQSIINAHNRGIKVRMVIDSDTNKTDSVKKLRNSGITVVDDQGRTAFMHNKFAVIDKTIVWTGSFNLTDSASWKHCDNAIKINNEYLAENYIAEFEEMFIGLSFGKRSPRNVESKIVRIGNKFVKTFFAPEEDVVDGIVSEIEKAKTNIKFMAYSFTHEKIADAVIKRAKKGVKVSGVFEFLGSGSISSNAIYNTLLKSGADLYTYKSPNSSTSFMHHKVFIIDDKTVSTGSFNFTHSASNENDENMLVIHSFDTAKEYSDEFERLKQNSTLNTLR